MYFFHNIFNNKDTLVTLDFVTMFYKTKQLYNKFQTVLIISFAKDVMHLYGANVALKSKD